MSRGQISSSGVDRLLLTGVRANQIVYRGVLAGNATWRAEVVPKPKPQTPDAVFSVDGFACPNCSGPLALRCIVLNPMTARSIIAGLQHATGPPGSSPEGDDR